VQTYQWTHSTILFSVQEMSRHSHQLELMIELLQHMNDSFQQLTQQNEREDVNNVIALKERQSLAIRGKKHIYVCVFSAEIHILEAKCFWLK